MPKIPIDYSKTIIYKLVCKDPAVTDLYVERTTNFVKRKNLHKSVCQNSKSNSHNFYVYQFIRKNGGFNNWDMIKVKRVNCKDKLEASKRERYWFEKLGATLNKNIPSRTMSEYNDKYKKDNCEKTREWNHIKTQCECGGRYTNTHEARHFGTQKHMAYVTSCE